MVFLHFSLKFKPFDEFFPSKTCLQISVCVASVGVCVCVCVHVHPLNKDVSQAITGNFLSANQSCYTVRLYFGEQRD